MAPHCSKTLSLRNLSASQIIEMIGEKIEEMAVGGDEGDEAEGEVPGLQAAPPAAPTPADDNLEDLD